jgi:hypothetical protein
LRARHQEDFIFESHLKISADRCTDKQSLTKCESGCNRVIPLRFSLDKRGDKEVTSVCKYWPPRRDQQQNKWMR